jgi:serine/threonine protein kinase
MEASFELKAFKTKMTRLEPDSVVVLEKVGAGAFGNVYRGVYLGTTQVALKTLTSKETAHIEEFEREAAILQQLKHPNVVQFIGIAQLESGVMYMVCYQYCCHNTLTKEFSGN